METTGPAANRYTNARRPSRTGTSTLSNFRASISPIFGWNHVGLAVWSVRAGWSRGQKVAPTRKPDWPRSRYLPLGSAFITPTTRKLPRSQARPAQLRCRLTFIYWRRGGITGTDEFCIQYGVRGIE